MKSEPKNGRDYILQQAGLISLEEAASRGIERLRMPKWAGKFDHLKIDIIGGKLGPWLHLWCPFNTECNGRDPVDTLITQYDIGLHAWEPYHGPLPDSEQYRAEVASYAGVLTA